MYSLTIQRRALTLLGDSILGNKIEALIQALSRVASKHPAELQFIIPGLFTVQGMPDWDFLQFGESFQTASYNRRHRHYQFLMQFDECLSLIRLATRIIRISSLACRAVLKSGYLGVLDGMLPNTPMQLAIFEDLDTEYKLPFLDACALSLMAIAAYPEHHLELRTHPVSWPWARIVQQGALDLRSRAQPMSKIEDGETNYRGMYFYCSISDLCNGFSAIYESPLLYLFKILGKKPHDEQVSFVASLFQSVQCFDKEKDSDGDLKYEAQTLTLLYILRVVFPEYLEVYVEAGLAQFLLERLRGEKLLKLGDFPEIEPDSFFTRSDLERTHPPSIFKANSAIYDSVILTYRTFRVLSSIN
ncbi:hypothetical protein HGRIS_010335 [Hohenbuehelia grisea]